MSVVSTRRYSRAHPLPIVPAWRIPKGKKPEIHRIENAHRDLQRRMVLRALQVMGGDPQCRLLQPGVVGLKQAEQVSSFERASLHLIQRNQSCLADRGRKMIESLDQGNRIGQCDQGMDNRVLNKSIVRIGR